MTPKKTLELAQELVDSGKFNCRCHKDGIEHFKDLIAEEGEIVTKHVVYLLLQALKTEEMDRDNLSPSFTVMKKLLETN
jgi:hypothetical protein